MELSSNALLTFEDFLEITGQTPAEVCPEYETQIIGLINYTSTVFEKFCNRPLKHRQYSYNPESEFYNPDFSIFDSVRREYLYLPTYPVTELTSVLVDDVEILPATDNLGHDGYVFYPKKGLLVYCGFISEKRQNIKIEWAGGYTEESADFQSLAYMCSDVIESLLNKPQKTMVQAEKIGNYSYTNLPFYMVKEMKGLTPTVFSALSMYRREVV